MLRLLAVLIAVPVISFGVAQGVLYKFNSDWRAAVAKEIDKTPTAPDSSPEEQEQQRRILAEMKALRDLPLQEVCSSPKLASLWTGCDEVQTVSFMGYAAVGAAVFGIALMVLIGSAGRLCKSSRGLLVSFFRPLLYFTVLALAGLILVHALLAIGAIYFGEGEVFGRIHVGIIAAIALGALAGVAGMLRGLFSIIRTATTTVVGKKQDLSPGGSLAQYLRELTARVGTPMPANVVVGLTPNFFVTEANVRCLDGLMTGRTLYLSLPLCRILSKVELAAVLGHEFGHFRGRDTEFSRKFYPIYRGTAESLAGLARNVGEGARATALIPALWTLSYFYQCFAAAETRLGRERELAADAVGARTTSPRAIATALLKVCAFAPLWDGIYDQMREAVSQGKQFINVSAYWAGAINTLRDRSVFDGIDTRHLAHPTDSHPPLGLRLDALHFSVSDLSPDALQTAPADAAIGLIAEHEALEKELTDVEHFLLADSMKGLSPDRVAQTPQKTRVDDH